MLENKFVIVRADRAGVFFGKLVNKEGSEVTLNECRKLYYWEGAAAVEQLAIDGVTEPQKCKFTITVENAVILGVIQIIPCTEKAIESLKNVSEWKQ